MTAHCSADAMTAWALRTTTSAGATTVSTEPVTLPDELSAAAQRRRATYTRPAVVDGANYLIGDAFHRFGHREHAGGLASLLFVGPVRRDPLGDELLLLLVQRELFGDWS